MTELQQRLTANDHLELPAGNLHSLPVRGSRARAFRISAARTLLPPNLGVAHASIGRIRGPHGAARAEHDWSCLLSQERAPGGMAGVHAAAEVTWALIGPGPGEAGAQAGRAAEQHRSDRGRVIRRAAAAA